MPHRERQRQRQTEREREREREVRVSSQVGDVPHRESALFREVCTHLLLSCAHTRVLA